MEKKNSHNGCISSFQEFRESLKIPDAQIREAVWQMIYPERSESLVQQNGPI